MLHGVALPAVDPVQYDRNRAEVMEFLYHVDGRGEPDHPQAHLYTGLAERFRQDAGQLVLEELTSTWHDPEARDALFDIGDV